MLLRAAAPKNWYKKNPQNLSFHITATHQLTQSDYLATLPNRVNSISKYLHSSTAQQRTDNSIRALMGSNLPSSLALYHTNMLFWPTWPRARCADGNQCQQQKNVKGQVLDFFGMLISKVSIFDLTKWWLEENTMRSGALAGPAAGWECCSILTTPAFTPTSQCCEEPLHVRLTGHVLWYQKGTKLTHWLG